MRLRDCGDGRSVLTEPSPALRKLWIEKVSEASPECESTVGLEEVLVTFLEEDPDPIVRHEAAFALGRLFGRGCIIGDLALDALCIAAKDDLSLVVRHEAAEAMAVFEYDRVSHVLEELLHDSEEDIVATARLALECGLIRNSPQA